MYRSELCNTNLLERNKTKHNQSKTHRYFWNLILNRYVIKNVEVSKYKDVLNPYFIEHTRKFNFFTVRITLRFYEDEHPLNHKINMSNYVSYNVPSAHYTTHTTEPATVFLHRVISIYFSDECSTEIIPEI